MALALDTTSTANNGTGTTLSWTHGGGSGTNRLALVAVFVENNAAISSVTYGGDAMTLVPSSDVAISGGNAHVSWYYKIAPATGSQTVTATFPYAMNRAAVCLTFTGADQTTPYNGLATNSAANVHDYYHVDKTTVSGDIALQATIGNQGGNIFVANEGSDTTVINESITNAEVYASYEVAAGTTTTVGWQRTTTWSTSYGTASLVVKAAASSATYTRTATATAALSSTGTRTATATAALSATATRTATASAALQGESTRTATADAALSSTNTRTATADAALSLDSTRTVPSTAALSATVTSTTPSTAALSSTNTRTVPTSANLTVQESLTAVARSLALTATARSLSTTATARSISLTATARSLALTAQEV